MIAGIRVLESEKDRHAGSPATPPRPWVYQRAKRSQTSGPVGNMEGVYKERIRRMNHSIVPKGGTGSGITVTNRRPGLHPPQKPYSASAANYLGDEFWRAKPKRGARDECRRQERRFCPWTRPSGGVAPYHPGGGERRRPIGIGKSASGALFPAARQPVRERRFNPELFPRSLPTTSQAGRASRSPGATPAMAACCRAAKFSMVPFPLGGGVLWATRTMHLSRHAPRVFDPAGN